ncbi:MAG: TerC family protein [Betaproteobacteria bacterium]
MADLFTPQFLMSVLEIILINILLSGDNAVVIALACRNLPDKLRRKGILWGVLGAIVLRIVLTFFAMSLLAYPWIKLVGAVLLIWIGIKLIAGEEPAEHEVKASDRLFSAIWTILIADLVMSLDNVMAVTAAAKGDLPLIVFGLVISIPLVIFGSQIIMRLIERIPLLVPAGGGLLGYIAGDLATDDPVVAPWIDLHVPAVDWLAPIVGVAVVVIPGLWLARGRRPAA